MHDNYSITMSFKPSVQKISMSDFVVSGYVWNSNMAK